MNYEEYKKKEEGLIEEFNQKKMKLMKEFVTSNNTYSVGQVICDHIGSILIEKMGFSWGMYSQPCATYYGIELNKDGKPNKRGNKRTIHQRNVVK